MNTTQLVDAVAEATGRSKADVTAVINATVDAVQGAVAAGDKVAVPGFGTFERRFREGGERRNPSTGGTVNVPDRHVPAFKPGAGFKAAVAGAEVAAVA